MSEKLGLVGRKVGMTRIFTEDGESIPVTVLEVAGNRVTQVKTEETDGYNAIQVAFGSKKPSRVSKPLSGHYAKAGVEAGEMLKEFHIDADKLADLKVGTTLSVEMFTVGQKVDVTGITIGKGFAGAIKRHHFSSNHAALDCTPLRPVHRALSVTVKIRAACSRASVWLVTWAMCRRTTQNLVVARVDVERQLLLVRGAVPGAKGGQSYCPSGCEGLRSDQWN